MDERTSVVSLIKAAKEIGAKGAEALRVAREEVEQHGSRLPATTRTQLQFVVRVWRDGGAAGVGTATTGKAALAQAWDDSANHGPDPLAGPAERMAIRPAGFGISDRRHSQLGDSDRAEILQLAEKTLSGCSFRPELLSYSQLMESRSWASSRGVDGAESSTRYRLHAEVVAHGLRLRHEIASRHFSDVASLPFGTELRRRVEPLLRPLPQLPELPVVLESRVVAELARSLAPAFAADRVRRGTSFLTGRLGKRLGPSMLHLTDDAGLFGGLYTHAFDDRGVPPIAVTLLKEGVVSGLYHDPESARAEGLRPTGHVRGGLLQPSNLIVRPGSRTRNVVLAELGAYVQLDQFPTLNVETGRVQGTVAAILVEKNERRGFQLLKLDLPIETVLGTLSEMIADHERSLEVDTPSAVFSPALLHGATRVLPA